MGEEGGQEEVPGEEEGIEGREEGQEGQEEEEEKEGQEEEEAQEGEEEEADARAEQARQDLQGEESCGPQECVEAQGSGEGHLCAQGPQQGTCGDLRRQQDGAYGSYEARVGLHQKEQAEQRP